jgi:manganese/iron transport system substrate-binding protein
MRLLLAALLSTLILGVVGAYHTFRELRPATTLEIPAQRLLVCSTTQTADFARQIVGDRWRVVSILAPGQDPHLYELKPGDATLVAKADLCVENGWNLEGHGWMERLARGAAKPLVTCVTGVQPLILDEEGEAVRDPHAWFAPRNAAIYVRNILAGVIQVDPAQAAWYERRAELYLRQLETVDAWARRELHTVPESQRVLVTSHDAFHYFCQAYDYRAAAPTGWSTGDEMGAGATNERRQRVVESIRDFGVKAIFVETSVNPKLLRAIAQDAGVDIGGELYSDSMGPPGSAGETYLGMLRENVLTIVEGLR